MLISSRDQNWGSIAIAMTVSVLMLPQAGVVAFLAQRSDWSGTKVGVLAEELRQLPFTLEQTAGYAEVTGCAVTTYLDLFHSHRQQLLQYGKPLEGYQATVVTTWGLAMTELATDAPVATC